MDKSIINNKLLTPLGVVKILLDNKSLEYKITKENRNELCYPNVNYIYKLKVELPNDNKEHEVACIIPELKTLNYEYEYCSDEHEFVYNIESKDYLLSIAVATENEFESHEENYEKYRKQLDNKELDEYLSKLYLTSYGEEIKYGIKYRILDFCKSKYVSFGIAWKNIKELENEKLKSENSIEFQVELAATSNSFIKNNSR